MSPEQALDGLDILLLEDELYISTALRDFFLMAGARSVEVCPTLSAAMQAVRETAFDAAVLDLVLPDGETSELAKLLDDKGVGIVFHSGHFRPDSIGAALPNAQFLLKPSAPEELVSAVAATRGAG